MQLHSYGTLFSAGYPSITRSLLILFLACAVGLLPILAEAARPIQETDDIVFSEDFEDDALDSRISIQTTGTFQNEPGIKSITETGSTKAYGFGRSTCAASCSDSYVTELIITLDSPTYVSEISFREMELYSDWGSGGRLFLDGEPEDVYIGKRPRNSLEPDTEPDDHTVTVEREVTEIKFRIGDITTDSEIFVDDIVVLGASSTTMPPPTSLVASAGNGAVELNWDANTEGTLEGYNVYRSTSSFGDPASATKLTSSPVNSATYTDNPDASGTTYFYRVTAVGTDGSESGLSGEVRATLNGEGRVLTVSGLAPLPEVAIQSIPASSTVDGGIYIFGGLQPGTDPYQAYDKAWTYDLAAETWNERSVTLPYGIFDRNSTAIQINDRFYLAPGFATGNTNGWGSHNQIIEVDFGGGSATETVSFPGQSRIWGIRTASSDGKIYYFGGHTGSDMDEIYAFDPEAGTLDVVATMSFRANDLSVVEGTDGWFYYISPNDGQAIERFNPATGAVEALSAEVPYDGSVNQTHVLDAPFEDAFYFYGRTVDPAVYKYDYAEDVVTETGWTLSGDFRSFVRVVEDTNQPGVFYHFERDGSGNPLTLTRINLDLNATPGDTQPSAWFRYQANNRGSSSMPLDSPTPSTDLAEQGMVALPTQDRYNGDVLSADVDDDGTAEFVMVREQRLYVIAPDGTVELDQDIAIPDSDYAFPTFLDDVSGDGVPDIAVAYVFRRPNRGAYRAHFYSGDGTLLKEFALSNNSDGSMRPMAVVDGDVIVAYSTGFALDPRGYARWDYETATETWSYDLGPSFNRFSMADADNDGTLELAYGNFTPHNGASGNGTNDGNNYNVILDVNGQEELKQQYAGGSPNGRLWDHFATLDDIEGERLLSVKRYTSYSGTSRIHVQTLDGSIEHTFEGRANSHWHYGWADITGDGAKEVVATNGVFDDGNPFTLYVLDASLNVVQSAAVGENTVFHALSDVDGDGTTEIVVSDRTTVTTYDPTLTEEWSWTYSGSGQIRNVIASDNDGDGRMNLGVLTEDALVSLEGTGTDSTIPVELASFDAQQQPDAVSLAWHTASETNNTGFEVQRRSDAGGFERIGFVEGAGTTAEPQAYRFRDAALPFADSLAYRLKQIDTDGTTAFSPTVVVRRGPGTEVHFDTPFPNPTRQQATVRYRVPEGSAQPVRLEVYNTLGQRVATLVDAPQPPGRETLTVDTARWSSGVYFLRLQVGDAMRSQRLTVVR